jgi:hypothetical protein
MSGNDAHKYQNFSQGRELPEDIDDDQNAVIITAFA